MTSPSRRPDGSPGEVLVHAFGRTDVGRTREHNEDSFLVADLSAGVAAQEAGLLAHVLGPRGSIFMVADGLGGAAAGELASEMAVSVVLEEMRHRWVNSPKTDEATFAAALKASAETANTRIHEFAGQHPEHRGMGTTATIAGLLGETLYLVQVGDSRAYLIRDGHAQQLTKDQSLMQRLIEAGEMTPEEAERSERRNIILQALGPEPSVKIDLTFQQLRRGDTLVLCTDGLSGLVRAEQISEVVNAERDLSEVCTRLIDLANENGGPDNITVVAARFEGEGLGVASSEDKVGYEAFHLGGTGPRSLGSRAPAAAPPEPQPPQPPAPPVAEGSIGGGPSRGVLLAVTAALLLAALLFAARQLRGEGDASPAPTTHTSTIGHAAAAVR
ncbi:MAG TPA: Stp1/IreP family PP2C-type Ser/Thr phosphatase [Gemmatimonadaceae bacterium]|nr:Stp1/IreP family PP2C-type Ser/Thr phosphatase [Gemmatimonadaceae bacterium]